MGGFSSLNGTGTGLLEGLLDVGESASHEEDSWVTPCPAGSRVDGYQVVKGGLIYQIRPRCSCQNCGASPGALLLSQPQDFCLPLSLRNKQGLGHKVL